MGCSPFQTLLLLAVFRCGCAEPQFALNDDQQKGLANLVSITLRGGDDGADLTCVIELVKRIDSTFSTLAPEEVKELLFSTDTGLDNERASLIRSHLAEAVLHRVELEGHVNKPFCLGVPEEELSNIESILVNIIINALRLGFHIDVQVDNGIGRLLVGFLGPFAPHGFAIILALACLGCFNLADRLIMNRLLFRRETLPCQCKLCLGSLKQTAVIGEGGFSKVFKVTALGREAVSVLKMIPVDLVRDVAGLQGAVDEAKVLIEMRHPYIVEYNDVFFHRDGSGQVFVCIETEHCAGGTILDLVSKGLPLPMNVLLASLWQVFAALAHVHARNLLHCDVKLDNLFVAEALEDGDGGANRKGSAAGRGAGGASGQVRRGWVKVGDFGLAVKLQANAAGAARRVSATSSSSLGPLPPPAPGAAVASPFPSDSPIGAAASHRKSRSGSGSSDSCSSCRSGDADSAAASDASAASGGSGNGSRRGSCGSSASIRGGGGGGGKQGEEKEQRKQQQKQRAPCKSHNVFDSAVAGGTAPYQPPECFAPGAAEDALGPGVDTWALACAVYEAVTCQSLPVEEPFLGQLALDAEGWRRTHLPFLTRNFREHVALIVACAAADKRVGCGGAAAAMDGVGGNSAAAEARRQLEEAGEGLSVLFEQMIALDPLDRPSLASVIDLPFFQPYRDVPIEFVPASVGAAGRGRSGGGGRGGAASGGGDGVCDNSGDFGRSFLIRAKSVTASPAATTTGGGRGGGWDRGGSGCGGGRTPWSRSKSMQRLARREKNALQAAPQMASCSPDGSGATAAAVTTAAAAGANRCCECCRKWGVTAAPILRSGFSGQ